MDQGADEETKSVQEEDRPIYLDKRGRRLFGTSQPSAFALGHPWPPIATNLGKKQVVRSRQNSKDSAASSSGEPSAQVVYVPKNVSDIELALYWDRVPRLERFQTLTCPVHGDILGVRRPSSLPPSIRRRPSPSQVHNGPKFNPVENHNKGANERNSISPPGNHNMDSSKLDSSPPENQMVPGATGSIIAPEDEQRKNVEDENNNQTIAAATADKSDEDNNSKGNHKDKMNGTSECATMTPAPVKVTTQSKTADKQIQIPDKEFSKMLQNTSPTFLCPLHGSYLNGIRRRNTPRFRTILLKDQEVQVDQHHLHFGSSSAAPCGRNHEGHNRTVDIHGARKVGNVYSKKNTVAFRSSSARRNREHSEYENNYRNPKIVAESDRLNRVPFTQENKRFVRSKSSYLRR